MDILSPIILEDRRWREGRKKRIIIIIIPTLRIIITIRNKDTEKGYVNASGVVRNFGRRIKQFP